MTVPFRPPPPPMRRSTKTALCILGGIAVAGATVPWMPSPSGLILLVVVVYVALPMLMLVVNDFIELRQERMLMRHLDVYGAGPDDPDLWVAVQYRPLAQEHLQPWRRWYRWLVASLGLVAAGGLLGAPVTIVAIVAAIALGREVFLAANVMEWLTPGDWPALTPAERMRLRACLLLMGLTGALIALLVASILVWMFVFVRPIRWNVFAFAACYGVFGFVAAVRGMHLLKQALRTLPPDERKAERPV